MNPISLAPLASVEASPVEQVVAAATAGFDAMGLRIAPAAGAFDLLADKHLRRETVAALRDTAIRLLETGNIRLAVDDDPSKFKPLLDVGAELGAEHVLVTGTDAVARPRVLDNFAALCDISRSAGLRPMIEFVSYRSIASLDQAHAIVTSSGCDAGICVDPLHLSRSGASPAALRGIDPRMFPYAHFCDAHAIDVNAASTQALHHESVNDRLYPGEGSLWLDEFVDAFPADIPLNVEAPHKTYATVTPLERASAALAATRRFLQRHYASRPVHASAISKGNNS